MDRLAPILTGVRALAMSGPTLSKTFVYVSNADDGNIDGYEMNAGGALTSLGKTFAGKLVMPMAVSPDQRRLYAVVRTSPFKVITFAVDPSDGLLKQEATAPLADSMPYISVDKTGRFLFTASYGGDRIAINPVEADGLAKAEPSQVIATGHNAHSILVDRTNKFVYASNLGSSQVLQFGFDADAGKLTPLDPPAVEVPEGNGPRHLHISRDNRFLYLTNELSGEVFHYAIDPTTGVLGEVSRTSAVPPGADLKPGLIRGTLSPTASSGVDDKPRIWVADIQVTPDDRFMYVTERTNSTISLLSVDPDTGKPTYLAAYATEKQPRGVGIDPTGRYLVATGEKSDRISVYAIDQRNGWLTQLGRYPVGKGANWVAFVTAE